MAFTEYQHRAGGLVPGGEHETFRMGIRAGASGRDLHGFDTGGGQDRAEGCGELPGAAADQEPEVCGAAAEADQEAADLLGSSPGSVRVGGDREDVPVAEPASMTNRQYSRRRVTAQSTWKKSAASMVAACVCRNCRQS